MLKIEGMPKVEELYALSGAYVNLSYPIPSGKEIHLLDDNEIYLGTQLECLFGRERCFGLVAGLDFLLVAEYGQNGQDPEIVIFKRR